MHQVELHDYIPMSEFGPHETEEYEYCWQGAFLQACFLSNVGRKRKNNEDACMLCVPQDPGLAAQRGLLFAVADGMGGASAGEFASRMALRLTTSCYYRSDDPSIPHALRDAVETANLKVFEESEVNPLLSGMGTTISVLVAVGEYGYIAHVGDSRVYLLRDGAPLQQITHDHSLVAEQMRCGLLTEEEARNHSMKNLITRAVGIKNEVKVDMYAVRLERGDQLLICTDGLSNQVPDRDIAPLIQAAAPREAARRLVNAALENGGSDNVTAALLRVTEKPPKGSIEPGIEEVLLPQASLITRLRRFFA
ncbi:MAG: Stp1/IreP family PP2C-type Ser/Thr phosphatase [Candidatus Hydrogenedentes bacterium]|nr:Stp1/IreP family PP2C-type Ser/Thr phosphatase [Candidatus Hydrogenedentota bacterium]